jgi:Putative arginyl-tRNA:protein arginylyltransferase
MTEIALKVGLTPEHHCSYLPAEQEQLMVLLDTHLLSADGYESLLSAGFRRSGSDIYRPYCSACHSCRSLRLPVAEFKPSRSQKRIYQKNQDLEIILSNQDKPEYYDLFAKYIHERHADGTMFPPSRNQYDNFLLCSWLAPYFVELRHGPQLLAVAITDPLPHSLSAMYTFYDAHHEHRSLGTFAIMIQMELAKKMGKKWLYLGYQVDGCRKMNYKRSFHPYQVLIDHVWKNEHEEKA